MPHAERLVRHPTPTLSAPMIRYRPPLPTTLPRPKRPSSGNATNRWPIYPTTGVGCKEARVAASRQWCTTAQPFGSALRAFAPLPGSPATLADPPPNLIKPARRPVTAWMPLVSRANNADSDAAHSCNDSLRNMDDLDLCPPAQRDWLWRLTVDTKWRGPQPWPPLVMRPNRSPAHLPHRARNGKHPQRCLGVTNATLQDPRARKKQPIDKKNAP